MDQIILKNMVFYAYHGNLPEENLLGQRFYVDLIMDVDLQEAGTKDDVHYTVNYAEVYELVKEVMEGKVHSLIESVAEMIASRVKEEFPRVVAVAVHIRKPEAPIQGILDYAEVVLRR